MKKELIILLFIVPLVFFYVFFDAFHKTVASKDPGITLQDDFEKLLGSNTDCWEYIQTVKDKKDIEFYKEIYNKNYSNQFNHSPTFKIPKIVHIIWLGPRPFPQESVENLRTWMAYHPDWSYKFWTDRKRLPPCTGVQVHYVEDFPFKFLKDKFNESQNWGEKSDILRYEILYKEGGVYIDHDANCLRPFHGLHRGYDFYACLEMPHEKLEEMAVTAGIGIVGSKPGHPIIRDAMQTILDRWDEVTKKFSANDPLIQAQRVTYRTYIALTYALQKNLNSPDRSDIVFPASYFYPKYGLKGFYSEHLYGTTWNNLNVSKKNKYLLDMAEFIRKRDNKILRVEFINLFALLGCFIFYFLINKRLNNYRKE